MGNLTMFGKSYDSVGSSSSNLLLKTKGDLKILWGSKYIDLIKDGKIASSCDIEFKIVDSEEDIRKDGLYLINNEESSEMWACIKGTKVNLSAGENTYVSFLTELKATAELKTRALKNIGFVYDTYDAAILAGLTSGIIYIVDKLKLYAVVEGQLIEYSTSDQSITSTEKSEFGNLKLDKETPGIGSITDLFNLFINDDIYIQFVDGNIHLLKPFLITKDSYIASEEHSSGEIYGKGNIIYNNSSDGYIETDVLIVRKELRYNDLEDILYEDLYDKAVSGFLVKNRRYRITDFLNEWELEHKELGIPLIVKALDKDRLESIAMYEGHENWTIEYDWSYRVLVYDPEKESPTEETSEEDRKKIYTKGRITRLTDEFGNSANFDFKHLKFYINDDFDWHHGYYLFSRNLTDKEKLERNNSLNNDNKELDIFSERELYKDASLDGRYTNNVINIESPKLYSQKYKRFILINNEEAYLSDTIYKNRNDRESQVIFIRELNSSDGTYESGHKFEEVCTKERTKLLKEKSAADIRADEELSETLAKLELGLDLHDNYFNNILGSFVFRYNMSNNSFKGTLHLRDKFLYTSLLGDSEETIKHIRIAADSYEIPMEYELSSINGRLIGNVINGDIIGLQTSENSSIQNCIFNNIYGVKINLLEAAIFSNNTFNNDIYDITIKNSWKGNTFNGEVTGICHIPKKDGDEDIIKPNKYDLIHNEWCLNKKEAYLGQILNCTIEAFYCCESTLDGIIDNCNTKILKGLDIKSGKLINSLFKDILDIEISKEINNTIFSGVIYGFYKEKSNRLGKDFTYENNILGTILNSTFNNKIIGLKLSESSIINNSTFNLISGIEIITKGLAIDNSQFILDIFGEYFELSGKISYSYFKFNLELTAKLTDGTIKTVNLEGDIDQSNFYAPILLLECKSNSIIKNSKFNDIEDVLLMDNAIIDYLTSEKSLQHIKITKNFQHSTFHENAQYVEFKETVDRTLFYDTLSGKQDKKIYFDTVSYSNFDKISNSKFEGQCINCIFSNPISDYSELKNLTNLRVYGTISASTLDTIKNSTVNGSISDSYLRNFEDCTFLNISSVLQWSRSVIRTNFRDDITNYYYESTEAANIDLLHDPSTAKDVYVINNKFKIIVAGGFLKGMILMWSGEEDIPKGWHICDGNEGTPNLIGLFIKGGTECVANDANHLADPENNTIKLKEEHLPAHSHPHKKHEHAGSISDIKVTIESATPSLSGKLYYEDYAWGIKLETTNVKGGEEGEDDTVSVVSSVSYSKLGGDVTISGSSHKHDASVSGGQLSLGEVISEEAEKSWTNSEIKIEPKSYSLIFIMKL